MKSMNPNRRDFLRQLGAGMAGISALSLLSACNQNTKRPNILFIMSDDHAKQAISCYGSDLIQTPQIDRLAKEGLQFNNSFVTNSICAPSRAVLLTGKYSHKNGLRDNRDTFDGSQQTFPKLLQQAGYLTAIVGKWHLKSTPTGFDIFKILRGQGEYYNPLIIDQEGERNIEGYTTDIITDLAIETLENRNPDQPFCMLVHHKAPHRNWMPNLKHLDAYADEDLPLPETFWDDYDNRCPAAREADMQIKDMFLSHDMKLLPRDYGTETGSGGQGKVTGEDNIGHRQQLNAEQLKKWDAHYEKMRKEYRESDLKGKELTQWKYQRYIKDYLRCILSVDENIGRLLDYLDSSGLAENTLVIYTSDQGFYLGEHGWYDKRFMYEESLGMPLLMRHPKMIKAGTVSEDIVLNLDFAPTFLDLAGLEKPSDMQGQSLRPLLQGNIPSDWRTSMYYHYYEYPHGWHTVKRHYGIRTDRYKLIHYYEDIDCWELFDLQKDPHELDSVFDDPAYADIRKDLTAELARLREFYGDETGAPIE
jgi:arylsulfatase A-like enzyme